MNDSKYRDLFKPEAAKYAHRYQASLEGAQISIAISLKRIADNLDKDRHIDETPSFKKVISIVDN